VKDHISGFPRTSDTSSKQSEHYQLLGNVAVKTLENALKIQKSSVKHYGGNPFATEVPLINMVSSDLITDDILNLVDGKTSQKRSEEFIQQSFAHI